MRIDFIYHLIASFVLYFVFKKFSVLVAIQIGKEIYDYIYGSGLDVLDWFADFLAILLLLVIKRL